MHSNRNNLQVQRLNLRLKKSLFPNRKKQQLYQKIKSNHFKHKVNNNKKKMK